jgi:predicted metal-binding membrane protein
MACITNERTSERAFLGVSALVFAASATATVVWSARMSAMGGAPMSGWMAWAPMCGETWLAQAASFLGMWVVMMMAMMLPSLAPMLRRYREAVGATRLGRLTALAAVGYFLVWAVLGMAVFPPGAALAAIEMKLPAFGSVGPAVAGVVIVIAGALQFTSWKARRLVCCRSAPGPGRRLRPGAAAALQHGFELGLECSSCCANLMAILLVVGVMDLRAMAAVTVAVAAERLAPAGERAARVVGVVAVGAGLILIAQAAGLG